MWNYDVQFQVNGVVDRVRLAAENFEDAENQARAMFNEPIEIIEIIRDRSKAYAHANQ
jgi:hypothetical protein